ncbi:MAG: CPBP family intramembrane metalloprotease [Gammaproteobacteria bacterium]|nr:CPBP family intramembrane metalloprotease [Gammaproteobacteria bacterium]
MVVSCTDGAAGRAQLWRSMVAWRIGGAAYFLAAVVPVLLFAGAYLAVRWQRGSWLMPEADAIFGTPAWGVALLAAALSGPGEEPGWRGFALRTVQRRHSALAAALIVGVLWWIWHLPMFLYRVDVHPAQALLFLVGLLAGSVWVSAVFNASGGSVFAAMLWHCVWNLASAIGRDFPPAVFLIMTSTVLVLAGLLIALWGPARLAPRSPRTS